MSVTDSSPEVFASPDSGGDDDGFKELPTGEDIIPLEEAVLNRLVQIQADLAALSERQAALVLAAKQIESSVAQAFIDLKELHSWSDIPTTGQEGSTLHRDQFRGAKTSQFITHAMMPMAHEADLTTIEIPGDGDWSRWLTAWESARERAAGLNLPRLPACPCNRVELDEITSGQLGNVDDQQLREFIVRFSRYLDEYERSLTTSKLFTSCQSLKVALRDALHADANADAQIVRAQQSLDTWEERCTAQHRWFAQESFDAELTEALTAVYDCLSALQVAQPQLVTEQLRHACDWLLYFLTLLGVHKDSGLSIGATHEQLPRQLRDKFSAQSLKPGRSADSCKISNVIRNRWYRIADDREIQVVRPWYELA